MISMDVVVFYSNLNVSEYFVRLLLTTTVLLQYVVFTTSIKYIVYYVCFRSHYNITFDVHLNKYLKNSCAHLVFVYQLSGRVGKWNVTKHLSNTSL